MKAPNKASLEPKTVPLQPNASLPQDEGVFRLARVMTFVTLIFSMVFIGTGSLNVGPQPFILAGFMMISMITNTVCMDNERIKSPSTRLVVMAGIFNVALIAIPVFFANLGVLVAILIIVFAILVSSVRVMDSGKGGDGMVTQGLVAAFLASLAGLYSPLKQVNVPFLVYLILAGIVLQVVLFFYLVAKKFITATLRIKITISALAVVIVPLSVVSVFSSTYLARIIQNETNTSLMTSAKVVADRIDEFYKTNRTAVMTQGILPVYAEYMALKSDQRAGSPQEYLVKTALDSLEGGLRVKERAYLKSFALLDIHGFTVYSTDFHELNWNDQGEDFFTMPLRTERIYYSPVVFTQRDQKPYIFFSTLVRDANRNVIGVLRAQYEAGILQSIAEDYAGALGKNSYPILFNEYFVRLADPAKPELVYFGINPLSNAQVKAMQDTAQMPPVLSSQLWIERRQAASGLTNSHKNPYFSAVIDADDVTSTAAVAKITVLPWSVVYQDDLNSLTAAMNSQNQIFTLIATLIAGLVSFGATFATRVVNDPISKLIEIAQAISNGRLDVKANIETHDEMGLLGNAFNLMTSQLQHMISSLEDRVRDRTHELEHQNDYLRLRARQMETLADVARGVASAQELEVLLQQVTSLVSERFNFYHVGIFLVDEQGEYAMLRAANSEGGQRMLDRQHKLKVGQVGMVGYVTETGEPRIATDVGKDAIFFNNTDLPLTRSEMALPLKVGERVIGALDVQSVESNAFSEEDIQLFSILADQIAIAIYNNLLYSETARALSEAQQVHRKYLAQEWNQELEQGDHAAYRYTPAGLSTQSSEEREDISSALETGTPIITTAEENGKTVSVMAIPVKLRGETIGVIRVQNEVAPDQDWSEEEIETVQAVADQVALALENARLFTQTARRAERERKVLEITSKIRSTNDPQVMMQIAVEELQKALRASRAQVILQPQAPEPVLPTNGNGNGNGNGHKKIA